MNQNDIIPGQKYKNRRCDAAVYFGCITHKSEYPEAKFLVIIEAYMPEDVGRKVCRPDSCAMGFWDDFYPVDLPASEDYNKWIESCSDLEQDALQEIELARNQIGTED